MTRKPKKRQRAGEPLKVHLEHIWLQAEAARINMDEARLTIDGRTATGRRVEIQFKLDACEALCAARKLRGVVDLMVVRLREYGTWLEDRRNSALTPVEKAS